MRGGKNNWQKEWFPRRAIERLCDGMDSMGFTCSVLKYVDMSFNPVFRRWAEVFEILKRCLIILNFEFDEESKNLGLIFEIDRSISRL